MPTSSFLNIPSGTDISVNDTTTQIPAWYQRYQQGLISTANDIASEPYTPYTGARVADPTADMTAAWDSIRAGQGQGQGYATTGATIARNVADAPQAFDSATPYFNKASSLSAAGAANPYISSATSRSVADETRPGLDAATGRYVDNVDEYLNPYMEASVGNLSHLMSRNLVENVLPGVNSTFTGTGQFGSSRHGDFTGRAIRDMNEGLSRTAADMLVKGYMDSASIYGADKSRQMEAAARYGDYLSGDLNRQLSAGQLTGSLTAADADRLLSMGTQAGSLRASDLSRILESGRTISQIGGDIQRMNLTDAGALEAAGASQRGINQTNLDTAYEDFLSQRDHPLRSLAIMQGVMQGQPIPGSGTTTTSTSPAPSTSPLAMLAGAAAGAYGLNRMMS